MRRTGPIVAAAGAAVLAVASLAGCGSSAAADSSPAKISVSGAYIPLPASPAEGVAYFDIGNSGGSADRLVSVSSSSVQSAVLNQSTTTSMHTVAGVDVPAHGEAHLARGGTHVMLMGITPAPKVGQQIELTLSFQHTGTVTVEATVQPMSYQPPTTK
ncbi:copper chaperone PCu(A)C [Streptacidiphilus sp. N1-12]|uniref:Copper chaperone PCu(A)C n=2 Tax=Streptacidiphilus alkalitolerans TaxID=3342712 RepID=A0ABV6WEZ3_9ACTN